jgi:hypothetical protein
MSRILSAGTRKWLANGGWQGHPTSQGRLFRRKGARRRLDHLVEEAKREPSPIAAMTHVRVIEVPESPGILLRQAAEADLGSALVDQPPSSRFVAAAHDGMSAELGEAISGD